MRHLGSIVLSLLLAPVVYLTAGFGLVNAGDAVADPASPDHLAAALALVALLAAGLLYAPLVLARLSPLGPVLAGLALLGAGAVALLAPRLYRDHVPVVTLGGDGDVAIAGLGVVLSVPLLLTLFSPRRWRRHADPPVEHGAATVPTAGGPAYPAPPAYPGPAGGPPHPSPATGPHYPPPPAGSAHPGPPPAGFPYPGPPSAGSAHPGPPPYPGPPGAAPVAPAPYPTPSAPGGSPATGPEPTLPLPLGGAAVDHERTTRLSVEADRPPAGDDPDATRRL